MRKSLAAMLTTLPLVLGSCYGNGGSGDCPCDEDLNTRGETQGIGRYEMGQRDSHISCLDYYNGHEGGLGDTLEQIGCEDDSVYMLWIGNSLHEVWVSDGWDGETSEGVEIGDSQEKFLRNYPLAGFGRIPSGARDRSCMIDGKLKAYFSSSRKITELRLSDNLWNRYSWGLECD